MILVNLSPNLGVKWSDFELSFAKVGRRFFRRADRIIAQKFVQSQFDWRVGIAGGKVLYVCQYMIPRKQWKILTYTPDGKTLTGPVKGVRIEDADPKLLDMALRAGAAIGKGLYGVDLKQVGSEYVVIEVNDNPTINAGDEDQKSGDLYERLVNFVLNGVAEGR